jgi:ankyrin repeat protein
MLKNYLIAHPDKLNDQFVKQSDVYQFDTKVFNESFNTDVFYQLFKSNKIDKLITYISQYDTFSLPFRNEEIFKNVPIVKILIDKDVTIEYINNQKLIHLICRYSTPDMIKYIIDKGVDLECSTSWGLRPIHYICQYSTPEMIKYIIDKGVDLECSTSCYRYNPIHFICRYSTPEMIKYIIDKGVNLECVTYSGYRPIHFICQYSTPEMIKYIIDKGVNLKCANRNRWKPIHFICRYSTPEMIKYIIDKGIKLSCSKTDEGWKPIHFICAYSTPDMVKYIIDKGVNISSCVSIYDGKSCNYSVRDIIDIRFKNRNIVDGFTKQDFIQHLIKKSYRICGKIEI